jgi:hypothetical protein
MVGGHAGCDQDPGIGARYSRAKERRDPETHRPLTGLVAGHGAGAHPENRRRLPLRRTHLPPPGRQRPHRWRDPLPSGLRHQLVRVDPADVRRLAHRPGGNPPSPCLPLEGRRAGDPAISGEASGGPSGPAAGGVDRRAPTLRRPVEQIGDHLMVSRRGTASLFPSVGNSWDGPEAPQPPRSGRAARPCAMRGGAAMLVGTHSPTRSTARRTECCRPRREPQCPRSC